MMPAPMMRILGLAFASSGWGSSPMTDICYFLKRFGIGSVSIPSDDKERRERLDNPGGSKENVMIGATLYDLRSVAIRAERISILKINAIPWQKPFSPLPTNLLACLIEKIRNIALYLYKYQLLFFKAGYIGIYRFLSISSLTKA